MQRIRIANIKQLTEYSEKFDDEKFIAETRFDFSECENIKIHIKGEKFESSINSNIIKALLILQDEIYREYAQVVYEKNDLRKLSVEEKEKLQLYFKITNGSTFIEIVVPQLFDAIISVVQDLPNITNKEELIAKISLEIAITVFKILYEVFKKNLSTKKNQNNKNSLKKSNKNIKIKFWKLLCIESQIEELEIDGDFISKENIQSILENINHE